MAIFVAARGLDSRERDAECRDHLPRPGRFDPGDRTKTRDAKAKAMAKVPITERQRRTSEGLRLAWRRRKLAQRKGKPMKCSIEFDCDNAAFEDEPSTEIGRILRDAAERIGEGNFDFPLYDVNGNNVGHAKVHDA